MLAASGDEFSVLLRATAAVSALLAIAICAWLALTSREELRSTRVLRVGHIDLPAVSFYKLLGLLGMFLIPAAAVSLASHELLVGTKEASACLGCHVMNPYGNDMIDPNSDLLAAKHFRNRWIPQQQCYQCHVDYGFGGTLAAKMDGLRHLLKYTTRTYSEPIALVHPFNNGNCLHCHAGAPKYQAEAMHEMMADVLRSNETPCTSCHGNSHPSREQRSPGHAAYDRLMQPVELAR